MFSRAQAGIDATLVTVEAHVTGGQGFVLSGLPETAVREARERVRSALMNNGFSYPDGRIVIHLAPADVVKSGGRFDLAIAIALLAATGQIATRRLAEFEFLGELGLSGQLRAVNGALCALLAISREPSNRRQLIVPRHNASECALAETPVRACAHLDQVVEALSDDAPARAASDPDPFLSDHAAASDELEPIVGQLAAKRALLIAAAGGHHLFMVGPPGTRKTLLARRLSHLLPDLCAEHALEVAAIYSAQGATRPLPRRPPFRDPHHSASGAALVGGGADPRPGEITMAHRGVLFLDELPEFRRDILDQLREPLESRSISIARARSSRRFPASFQLVTAMNPCPAGRVCSSATCRCTSEQVRRYQSRVSGPLLDRIDLHVQVPQIGPELLRATLRVDQADDATALRARVAAARERQRIRQGCLNAHLATSDLGVVCALDDAGNRLLGDAMSAMSLSARSVHRILKVARTIADLALALDAKNDLENTACATDTMDVAHLTEAIGYRALDWDTIVS